VRLAVRLVGTMHTMGTRDTSRSVRASHASGGTVCAVGTSSGVSAVRSVRSVGSGRVSNTVAVGGRCVSAETAVGSGGVGAGGGGVLARRASHAVARVVVAATIAGDGTGNVLLQNRRGNLSGIRGILVVTVCAKEKREIRAKFVKPD
jgi:hypothetical protein